MSTASILPEPLFTDASWIQTVRWQALTTDQQKEFPPIAPDFVIDLNGIFVP